MSTTSDRVIAGVRIPPRDARQADSLFGRLWLAIPDWLFQFAGAAAMLVWLGFEIPVYLRDFWNAGAYYQFADGTRWHLPWTRVLVDINILLIALAFVCRMPARTRARRASDVLLGLLGGWWPMIPFVTVAVVSYFDAFLSAEWKLFLQRPQLNAWQLFGGASLIMFGNAVDVLGYSTLFRSFSIVPEARSLKTTGLYRFVRHPVYLGQFFAQAGVWLVFAPAHWIWWSYFGVFVGLQLWRSKREDTVLEEAFGDDYRTWKQKTFWFV